jgi:hypothetical protein
MEDLEKRKAAYGICGECNEPGTGNHWCKSCNAKRFKKNFKNWTSGNKDINLMLYIVQNILNGYLSKILKMLLMLPEVNLVKFIQLFGLKDIFVVGILKIEIGSEFQIQMLH